MRSRRRSDRVVWRHDRTVGGSGAGRIHTLGCGCGCPRWFVDFRSALAHVPAHAPRGPRPLDFSAVGSDQILAGLEAMQVRPRRSPARRSRSARRFDVTTATTSPTSARGSPLRLETPFHVASVTRRSLLLITILRLVDSGRVSLDAPILRYIHAGVGRGAARRQLPAARQGSPAASPTAGLYDCRRIPRSPTKNVSDPTPRGHASSSFGSPRGTVIRHGARQGVPLFGYRVRCSAGSHRAGTHQSLPQRSGS